MTRLEYNYIMGTSYFSIELAEPVFGYLWIEKQWTQVKSVTVFYEPDGVIKNKVFLPDGREMVVDVRRLRTRTPEKFARHPEAPLNVFYENTKLLK